MSADLPSPESSAGARGSANAEAEPRAACNGSSGLVGVGGVLPPMLDACCGSRMFWFNRSNPLALYMDKREEQHVLCDGRELKISPDVVADFTDMPFPDESFWLVVFDPPHMNSLGANSWLAKKYGRLIGDWRDDLREGFAECFRVLKTNGTLVFKWNTTDISLDEVLALAPCPPVFGHTTGRQAKTVWATFFKGGGGAEHGERNGAQQSGPSSPNKQIRD
jgi:hypothetical protein